MIVIVGSRHDPEVTRLRDLCAPSDARLLSCEDLSRDGWIMRDTSPDSAVVEKKLICVADIDGIVVRRSQIYPSELGHIIARDRAYVACEMTAFLVHWLRCLACPVVNMPSGVCLCGPMWSPFAWTHHAAQMGIPVVKQTRHGMRDQHRGATTEVVMLDGVRVAAQEDTVTSDADIRMSNYTRQLAVSSGARLLSARFMLSGGRPHFVGATPVPPVTQMLARALQVVITQSKSPLVIRDHERA